MPKERRGPATDDAVAPGAAGREPGKRARTDGWVVQRSPSDRRGDTGSTSPPTAAAVADDPFDWRAMTRPAAATVQRKADDAAPGTGDAAMWNQVIGEHSTPVGKLARVQAPRGVRLRKEPAPGAPDGGVVAPFDDLVHVERRTEHGWCWVIGLESQAGRTGFCEEHFLAVDPPEPLARLHRVEPGERLADIAVRHYGADLRDANHVRLYVQALYLANKGRAGVYLDDVDLGLRDMVGRGRREIETVETYKEAKVRAGLAIWLPTDGFILQMKAAGMVSDGASAFSRAARVMTAAAKDVGELATYGAGFTVGLLHGAWNAIADLFVGAADMIEAVAKAAYHVVTGNPMAVKDMLMGWVDKLGAAWAGRDKLMDEFMRKWEADDGWERGNFQGEVLGWVMMTALIAILTAGEGAVVLMTGRWAHVLRALKTLDALGDVTSYARKVGKLPARAVEHVQSKLGGAAVGRGARTGSSHDIGAPGDQADLTRGGSPDAEELVAPGLDDGTIRSSRAAAIHHGHADLSTRQAKLLAQLPENLARLTLHKRAVSINDLAALTAKTGDEFAVFTRGSQRLVIRGGPHGVDLLREELAALRKQGWKWSGHTHPGTSDLVLNASGRPGDRLVLEIFGQQRSVILNERGARSIFDRDDDTRVPTGGRR